MEWGDPGEALRAKTELAIRHAAEVCGRARVQLDRAAELRRADREAVEAAKSEVQAGAAFLHCEHCSAVWRAEAVAEVMRRKPRCLLCGGPLAPVP
jgi:hypothetical protein